MTADELRAIRERNEKNKTDDRSVTDDRRLECNECYQNVAAQDDIDALLAEVERLRMHGLHECPACGWDHDYQNVKR